MSDDQHYYKYIEVDRADMHLTLKGLIGTGSQGTVLEGSQNIRKIFSSKEMPYPGARAVPEICKGLKIVRMRVLHDDVFEMEMIDVNKENVGILGIQLMELWKRNLYHNDIFEDNIINGYVVDNGLVAKGGTQLHKCRHWIHPITGGMSSLANDISSYFNIVYGMDIRNMSRELSLDDICLGNGNKIILRRDATPNDLLHHEEYPESYKVLLLGKSDNHQIYHFKLNNFSIPSYANMVELQQILIDLNKSYDTESNALDMFYDDCRKKLNKRINDERQKSNIKR
jgi:hypothetical protein